MFDSIFQTSVVPLLQEVFGTTVVVYRHARATKEINAVFANIEKTTINDESGNQQTVEVATIHVPLDSALGIDSVSIRAIIEEGGRTWAIESVMDESPSMATVTARRILIHEHSQRNRK